MNKPLGSITLFLLVTILLLIFEACSSSNTRTSPQKSASLVEVKGLLLSKQQVGHYIANPEKDWLQPSFKELRNEDLYLLVEIKTIQGKVTRGVLDCQYPVNGHYTLRIASDGIYAIPLGKGLYYRLEGQIPDVRFQWEKLQVH